MFDVLVCSAGMKCYSVTGRVFELECHFRFNGVWVFMPQKVSLTWERDLHSEVYTEATPLFCINMTCRVAACD